jgi:hypothetical protein
MHGPASLDNITANHLRELPLLAIVGFAAKCARRVVSLNLSYTDPSSIELERIIARAEAFSKDESLEINPHTDFFEIGTAANLAKRSERSDRRRAMLAVAACAKAADARGMAYINGNFDQVGWSSAADYVEEGLGHACHILLRTLEAAEAALGDFRSLLTFNENKSYDATNVIPENFFTAIESFKVVPSAEESSTLIERVQFIPVELMEQLRRFPGRLYSLSPREFEEVIAELFTAFRFNVDLTARTRDGGRDIIAVSNDIVNVKYIIECKRYAECSAVGVHFVRALHGVTIDEKATKGILATTSHLTRPASDYIRRNRWVLEGKDFEGLVEWLDIYRRFRLANVNRGFPKGDG